MADATDLLEQLMYQVIFEKGFADTIVDTENSVLVLYGAVPNEDGSGGAEFGDPLSGIQSILALGYTSFPMFQVGPGDTFEAVAAKTGIWQNAVEMNFGNNSSASPWVAISAWGILDPTIATPNIYLRGTFRDEFGADTSFVVDPGKDFIIPVGSFLIEIR